MTIFLPTLAVAFSAFCVWLTVRFVNRRELWAKWTLAVVVGVPLLYFVSFGPACWIHQRTGVLGSVIARVYSPIAHRLWPLDSFWHRPTILQKIFSAAAVAYAEAGSNELLLAWDNDAGPAIPHRP
ncbi:MAG: hypothetical protein JSS02_33675 [Planctomycetes bacterium]|nr:hypothetical protein [Planctomycetota bacterium]